MGKHGSGLNARRSNVSHQPLFPFIISYSCSNSRYYTCCRIQSVFYLTKLNTDTINFGLPINTTWKKTNKAYFKVKEYSFSLKSVVKVEFFLKKKNIF
jgi:hypothetical protein